jgi:hypothetical protein
MTENPRLIYDFSINSEADDTQSWGELFRQISDRAIKSEIDLDRAMFTFGFNSEGEAYVMNVKVFDTNTDDLPEFIWIDIFKDERILTQAFGQALWSGSVPDYIEFIQFNPYSVEKFSLSEIAQTAMNGTLASIQHRSGGKMPDFDMPPFKNIQH